MNVIRYNYIWIELWQRYCILSVMQTSEVLIMWQYFLYTWSVIEKKVCFSKNFSMTFMFYLQQLFFIFNLSFFFPTSRHLFVKLSSHYKHLSSKFVFQVDSWTSYLLWVSSIRTAGKSLLHILGIFQL